MGQSNIGSTSILPDIHINIYIKYVVCILHLTSTQYARFNNVRLGWVTLASAQFIAYNEFIHKATDDPFSDFLGSFREPEDQEQHLR